MDANNRRYALRQCNTQLTARDRSVVHPQAMACGSAWSGSFGRLVLLDHAGRDPASADRDAVVFGPGPDLATALPACRSPRSPACRPAPRLAGVLDERRELRAEGPGVLLAQVDLVIGAVEPEPHRLVRRAAV